MVRSVCLALLATGFGAGLALGDDVHLTNGEKFEGVIAERTGGQVRIQLEFGELKLPATSVERIETAHSPLAEYRVRRTALLSRSASATEWLELARWARRYDLPHGYREGLLEAAAIDPGLEGLAPALRGLGYVLDDDLDRWIPYSEYLRRTAPPVQREPVVRQASERRAVEETLSRTVELLALAQLEREARETRQSTPRGGPSAPHGFPVAHFVSGFVFGPPIVHRVDGDRSPAQPPSVQVTSPDLFTRPPGSLIPVGGANRGARFRQPGSLLPVRSGRR